MSRRKGSRRKTVNEIREQWKERRLWQMLAKDPDEMIFFVVHQFDRIEDLEKKVELLAHGHLQHVLRVEEGRVYEGGGHA
jgi:hypothetical protein